MRSKKHLAALALGALPLLPLLSGCSPATDLDNPEWARIILSAPSSVSVEVLTSQKFLVTEGSVQLMESATDTVRVPFDKTYALASPARFYVRFGNLAQEAVVLHVKILLEDRKWMDEDKALAPGEQAEFIYRYDMPTPNG